MKKYLILFALILIQGCSSSGGGGDNTTPTDPNTVFQLFEAGLFTAGHTSTTNYTGSDSTGGTYTATWSTQTQVESTFLGVPAIPIFGQLQLTDTSTGAFASVIGHTYYSPLATDRHILGRSISTSTTTVSSTTSAIPQTAKIGDIGIIGTYIDNAGDIDNRSWRIDDGGNGTANIVTLSTVTDQFGNIISSSVVTVNIDVSGNELSEKLVLFSATTGITVTLNSN